MALGTLSTSDVHTQIQTSLNKQIQQQSNPFQEREQLQIAALAAQKRVPASEQSDRLAQAISIEPSIKGIMDLITESQTKCLTDALRETQIEWRKSNIPIIENIGAFVLVHRIMTVIQSMCSDAEKILIRIGAQDIRNADLLQRYTQLLIDLAQSSMPSTLIEKIIVSTKSIKRRCKSCTFLYRRECKDCLGDIAKCNCVDDIKCRCTDFKVYLLSILHLHARGWPQSIWINSDARSLVLDQLLKKQDAPSGLSAKRMMR
jgi:hypothetical protein